MSKGLLHRERKGLIATPSDDVWMNSNKQTTVIFFPTQNLTINIYMCSNFLNMFFYHQ